MSYGYRLNYTPHGGHILVKRLYFLPVLLLLCGALWGSESATANSDASGGVILKWTAPGDDGYTGLASRYEIRYQPMSLGPLDTDAEWRVATLAEGAPFPSPAGRKDSALVLGLTPGAAYYFALKTFDHAGNASVLSNSPLIAASLISCCHGRVGDVNGYDGDEPTISDVSMLIDHLFLTQRALWCPAEADINLSGGANPRQGLNSDITISDVAMLIDYLFVSGTPLPNCY